MPSTAAIIGGGVIGAGWAARFLLHGWNVRIFDTEPETETRARRVIDRARLALPGLGDVALPEEGTLSFHGLMSETVAGADWVQESVPERLELKQTIYQTLQEHMDPGALLGSSTSGFTPTELQALSRRPEQILVTHPFNPVYLLPLVELVGSDRNGAAVKARAVDVLESIGMYPLQVRGEIPAHIADRLLEAVWRESLWMVRDGVATTQDVDEAIRMGFGLRWAQMGLFETYRIAGGDGGMAHFVQQFGPALKWPWSRLTDVPELDTDLVRRIGEQSDDQSGHLSIPELEDQRDRNLVGILRALRAENWGAGAILGEGDARRLATSDLPETFAEIGDLSQPVATASRAVPLDWVDYNGHMNEARYLDVFCAASDRLMALVGCDADYIADGQSFFTAETHIRHLDEARAGQPIRVETQVLSGAGKRLHLWHEMRSGDRLIATGEHMLLHVDLDSRRACDMPPLLADRVAKMVSARTDAALPEGAGRHVGQPRPAVAS